MCGRGLKLDCRYQYSIQSLVARRVRAWIETDQAGARLPLHRVARRVRAWIETLSIFFVFPPIGRRPPCAGVD